MAEERVAIVTGAARGIGLACARRFAADGAKVVLADRDDKAGREAAKELGDEKTALYVHCDVSSRLEVHNLIAETLSAFGRIDVLVNNAGMISPGTILDLEEDAFDKVMGVNLKGAFLVAQAVARQMVKQVEDSDERVRDLRRRHAIINMSSINQTVAIPNQLAYCVSKGGMGQLTKAMALALGLCAQSELDAIVQKAAEKKRREDAAKGIKPEDEGDTLKPATETSGAMRDPEPVRKAPETVEELFGESPKKD